MPSYSLTLLFVVWTTPLCSLAAVLRMATVTPQEIEARLKEALAATHYTATDLSDGCGAKYDVVVVSPQFEGTPLTLTLSPPRGGSLIEASTVQSIQKKHFTSPSKSASSTPLIPQPLPHSRLHHCRPRSPLSGKPLLARHRAVNTALAEELKRIHAITLKTLTPEQYDALQAKEEASS